MGLNVIRSSAFRSRRLTAWAIGAVLFLLGACVPVSAPLPTPTVTPTTTQTPTLTATIDWFPATETPTAPATLSPTATPELRTGISDLILQDDFSEAEAWSLGSTAQGSAALGLTELTLAIFQPRGAHAVFRSGPSLANFYLEVTASTSLCSGLDEYGLLLRSTSAIDFYRLALSCNGQLRFDRVIGGTASSPQPWLISAAVPSGAPAQVRLGVWAAGREFQIFIGDQYQFSTSDPMLISGSIGFFARAAGDTAVTVNFSDLAVWQVNP